MYLPVKGRPMGIERITQRQNDPAITAQSALRRTERANGDTQKPDADRVRPATDTVEISDQARELARARQAVDAAPDVRTEKVASIKKRIADGTYSVSPELLARKLMESNNADGLS
jgi:negative regulator of flagellin synthesis FlgM